MIRWHQLFSDVEWLLHDLENAPAGAFSDERLERALRQLNDAADELVNAPTMPRSRVRRSTSRKGGA